MFEYLSQYNRIFVSGPQRSGTRIATKMISADTGFTFVPEENTFVANKRYINVNLLTQLPPRSVIQSPQMICFITQIIKDDDCCVFMVRKPEDILQSCQRVGLCGFEKEKSIYKSLLDIDFKNIHTCIVKQILWFTDVRYNIKNPVEIAYDSLKQHPLWIDKRHRRNFGIYQTTI